MKIIPVIDLLDAHVVRGVAGNRSQYLPIKSPLCATSRPNDLVTAFLHIAPFDTIYIADLNALEKNGDSTRVITSLMQTFPEVNFWVDAGFDTRHSLENYLSFSSFVPILASETLSSIAQYHELAAILGSREYILSLDHRSEPLGPAELFSKPTLWPNQIIVMTLNTVGQGQGPDFAQIAHYQALAPKKQFIAAGGVRNDSDLDRLRAQGAHAVLVASALHNGEIDCRPFLQG